MPSNSKVSIIIPIIRPDAAQKCIDSIKANAGIPEDKFEIVTDIDHDRIGCPRMVAKLVAKSKYDLVCFMGDDTTMEPWCLSEAIQLMDRFPDGWGLVGFADGTGRKLPTHWLAHKRLLDYLDGEFFSTAYAHCFCDNELMDRAMEIGRYQQSTSARITHNHPLLKGEEITDPDLKRVYSDKVYNADQKTYYRRKKARLGPKLGIGLPIVSEMVHRHFFISYILMQKPDHMLLLPTPTVGQFASGISAVRNSIVNQALENGCTHLIMADTDQTYPVDTIAKLLRHNNKPIIGTPVHRRYPPFDPILLRGEMGAYRHVPDEECYSGKLIPVDATGTGCVLFNTDVFLSIDSPWFDETTAPNGKHVGEDIHFCHKCRKAGIEIHVDTSIEIGHLTTYEIKGPFTYQLFKKLKHFEYVE